MNDGEDHADVDAAASGAPAPRRDDPSPARADSRDLHDALETREDRAHDEWPVDERRGDERVDDDPFGPPKEPCECYCLQCRRQFMSGDIWFQRITNAGKIDGFWMCPTPNCDGKGFTFDIFPTNPDHPANDGWYGGDDDEDDDDEAWDEPLDAASADGDDGETDYDPDETKWKRLDEQSDGEDDDDIEGEEWKYGLQPGDPLPDRDRLTSGHREREDQEWRFDLPDERPREIEWEFGEGIDEDDIPF